jgi:hypothetical protein
MHTCWHLLGSRQLTYLSEFEDIVEGQEGYLGHYTQLTNYSDWEDLLKD